MLEQPYLSRRILRNDWMTVKITFHFGDSKNEKMRWNFPSRNQKTDDRTEKKTREIQSADYSVDRSWIMFSYEENDWNENSVEICQNIEYYLITVVI